MRGYLNRAFSHSLEGGKLNPDKIFIPLEIGRLRPGEPINFDIYLKSGGAAEKNEYVLFCSRGEIFNPGARVMVKLNTARTVYYEQCDRESVERYLAGTDKLSGDGATRISNQNKVRTLELKQRSPGTGAISHEDYFPLPIRNLQPGIEVNFDIFRRINVIEKDDFNYSILLPKGEVCRLASINKIHESGTKFTYFHKRDEVKVFSYLNHNLKLKLRDDNLPPARKAELISDTALLWSRRFFDQGNSRTSGDLAVGFNLIDNLAKIIIQEQYYRQWLPGIRGYDGNLYVHSLNICLLGLGFARYLHWEENKIMEFGRGSLLHDIGMVKIPRAVLNKSMRLTEDEMGQIKKHPEDSHHIVKNITYLSTNSNLMILQHHETGDGSGYPKGLRLPLINHWARILRIIDSYEALTSNRSWRKKYNSTKALHIMRQECLNNGIFDIDYLLEFIKYLGAVLY